MEYSTVWMHTVLFFRMLPLVCACIATKFRDVLNNAAMNVFVPNENTFVQAMGEQMWAHCLVCSQKWDCCIAVYVKVSF